MCTRVLIHMWASNAPTLETAKCSRLQQLTDHLWINSNLKLPRD